MQVYEAYCLRIGSELPLPPLRQVDGVPDAVVRLGTLPGMPDESTPGIRFEGGARNGVLAWDAVGRAAVRNGNEVVLELRADVHDDSLRAFLLGPVLGVLLTQRGLTTLHASAVALDGRAVAFAGDAGRGKSTLAAALHARGHAVLADDIVAVEISDIAARVLPGIPQLKLWPDVAARLGDAERLRHVRPGVEKRIWPTRNVNGRVPLPLDRVFVLSDGTDAGLVSLSTSEAAIELVRHSFGVRALHATAPLEYLMRAARVAGAVPVVRLRRGSDLGRLDELASLVESEVAAGRSA